MTLWPLVFSLSFSLQFLFFKKFLILMLAQFNSSGLYCCRKFPLLHSVWEVESYKKCTILLTKSSEQSRRSANFWWFVIKTAVFSRFFWRCMWFKSAIFPSNVMAFYKSCKNICKISCFIYNTYREKCPKYVPTSSTPLNVGSLITSFVICYSYQRCLAASFIRVQWFKLYTSTIPTCNRFLGFLGDQRYICKNRRLVYFQYRYSDWHIFKEVFDAPKIELLLL